MEISILCWGGIGDTLRNISLVPHALLHRRFGISFPVVYRHWKTTGALPIAAPPEPEFFESLISRIPSLRWEGESDGHRGTRRLLNKALREAIRLARGGVPRYFPFPIHLSEQEQAVLPSAKNEEGTFRIGIQTHLGGMPTKRWGAANWRMTLERLLEAHPHLEIVLLDHHPEVTELCFDPRIIHSLDLNIAQSIHFVSHLDLLVSIDSWAKYAAAWSNVPQIVIVPDQRPDYPGLTAEKLAREEFAGILDAPSTRLIGLERSRSGPQLTLGAISNLTHERLVSEIAKMIPKSPEFLRMR